jgi:hypothetical protein
MSQYRLTIDGKLRIIKNVYECTDEAFCGYYRNYRIHCWIDERKRSYAVCTHPDGGLIVDGYIGDGNLHKAIVECVENILL